MRGATIGKMVCRETRRYFNSHSPCGERLEDRVITRISSTNFNSHSPCGSDSNFRQKKNYSNLCLKSAISLFNPQKKSLFNRFSNPHSSLYNFSDAKCLIVFCPLLIRTLFYHAILFTSTDSGIASSWISIV